VEEPYSLSSVQRWERWPPELKKNYGISNIDALQSRIPYWLIFTKFRVCGQFALHSPFKFGDSLNGSSSRVMEFNLWGAFTPPNFQCRQWRNCMLDAKTFWSCKIIRTSSITTPSLVGLWQGLFALFEVCGPTGPPILWGRQVGGR